MNLFHSQRSELQSELNLADLWKDTEFVSRLKAVKGNREGVVQLFHEKGLVIVNPGAIVSCGSYWVKLLGRKFIYSSGVAYNDGQYYRITFGCIDSDLGDKNDRLLSAVPISWEEARSMERGERNYQASQDMERGGENEDVAMQNRGFHMVDGEWQYMHYIVDDLKKRPLRLRIADTSAR